MTTPHTEWLQAEARAGRGGNVTEAQVRGEDIEMIVNFESDQSASTFTGSVAESPGATSLADFTVVEGAWDGSTMQVTFTIAGATTLPADGDADGLSHLVFSIEQDAERIIGGLILISEAV